MWRSLIFTAACLVVAGCADPAGAPAQPGDVTDVQEAVFRYRLKDRPAEAQAYLAVDDQDPSAELLIRLRRDWPNLKPRSEEPKEKGSRVYVEGLKWLNRDTAAVRAGQWSPGKFGGQGYFADHRVVRDGGRWVVEKVTNETMS